MSRVIRNIASSAGPLRRAAPRDGHRSREAPLLYTERDLSEAVHQAAERGREAAAQEAEALRRQLDRTVENALGAIQQSMEGYELARRELLDVSSKEVLELALEVARAVVGSEIGIRPESIEAVVAELLEELRDAERVTVRLAPGTLQGLRDRGGALSDDRVCWIADDGMGPSDARVDSDRGGWDVAVETRWRRIADAVRGARIQQVADENRIPGDFEDLNPGPASEETAA